MSDTHPVHGVQLEIGGARHSVRTSFALSLAIEEKYGSVFEVAQKAISQQLALSDLAGLLELMVPGASRGEIEAHFDEVGIVGVITEISMVFAQIMRGWREINGEVEKASPLPKRRGAGRPRGAKNKPKEADASPGEISSAELPASESAQPSSGELPLLNSPASGELPVSPTGAETIEAPLANGHASPQQPASPIATVSDHSSGDSPGTA